MVCKRCGYSLPDHGFQCPNCHFVMNEEQIKKQQELMNKPAFYQDFVSMKYGVKKAIYEKREEEKKKNIGFLWLFLILFLIFILGLLVYFI